MVSMESTDSGEPDSGTSDMRSFQTCGFALKELRNGARVRSESQFVGALRLEVSGSRLRLGGLIQQLSVVAEYTSLLGDS